MLASSSIAGEHAWLVKHPVIVGLHTGVNAHRQNAGVHALTLDTAMCQQAQRHAVYMSTYGFGHSGMPYMEIINQSQYTPQDAINSWSYSGPHNGIMLSGATRVGFGYAKSVNGYPYWVGIFR